MLITRGSLVRVQPALPVLPNGGLAQLGEHLLCKQEVVGSIPSSSTKKFKCKQRDSRMFMFDLLEIKCCTFFNNLEEVSKFLLIANTDRWVRWVMIVCINKRNNVVLLISINAPCLVAGANVIGTSE